MITILERAKQALAHHDKFNKFGDEHALYMCPGLSGAGTLYELPHAEGQFTLADLRALVDYAERSPRVGDGSGDAAIAIGEHAFKAGYEAAAGTNTVLPMPKLRGATTILPKTSRL